MLSATLKALKRRCDERTPLAAWLWDVLAFVAIDAQYALALCLGGPRWIAVAAHRPAPVFADAR